MRPTYTVEMLIKFQHRDSDYSFFLGALLEKIKSLEVHSDDLHNW